VNSQAMKSMETVGEEELDPLWQDLDW